MLSFCFAHQMLSLTRRYCFRWIQLFLSCRNSWALLTFEDTSCDNILDVLFKEMKNLTLDFMNMCEHSYDNGVNIEGRKSGVQTRFLENNPSAFFITVFKERYNLLLSAMAKSFIEGLTFFGIIHCLNALISVSITKWHICRKFVQSLSPKPACRYHKIY